MFCSIHSETLELSRKIITVTGLTTPQIILKVTKIVRKDSPGQGLQLPDCRGEVAGGLGDLPHSPGRGEVVPVCQFILRERAMETGDTNLMFQPDIQADWCVTERCSLFTSELCR